MTGYITTVTRGDEDNRTLKNKREKVKGKEMKQRIRLILSNQNQFQVLQTQFKVLQNQMKKDCQDSIMM